MKPGPAISTCDQIVARSLAAICFGEIARFAPWLLGQHHRGIGRHVAMRGIARRLDHDPRQIEATTSSMMRSRRWRCNSIPPA
jgi:hypothetical protein